MTENNDIVIKKLVFKITQDNSYNSNKIVRGFNDFLKRKVEFCLQKILKKYLDKYRFQDLNIDKISFDIGDISDNGNFSEQKFLDSFSVKLDRVLEDKLGQQYDSINLQEKYDFVIDCFEKLCKRSLDENKNETFFKNLEILLDTKPEIIQDSFDVVLKNKVFFENFFESTSKNNFIKVINFLRKNGSVNFSPVFELYKEKVFPYSEDDNKIVTVNPSLQHLNLNEKQVNFIRRELRKNKNLDKILQNDFYFTEEQSSLIKENIIEKDFNFILKNVLKLKEHEIELIEQNVKNKNLNFVLKDEIKLNDQQIVLVKDSIGAKDLDFVLRNEFKFDEKQIVAIKRSLKVKSLDQILKEDLKLKEEEIRLIKKTLESKSLDFVLKNDFKLEDEQIFSIKDSLDIKNVKVILQEKLGLQTNKVDSILQSKDVKSLEFILRELLKFDEETIELIKKSSRNKSLDNLLLEDFKLNREHVRVIRESLKVRTLEFIMRNELNLDEEQIKSIKNTFDNKSLNTLLENDLEITRKKISLIAKTLRDNDIEVVLRENLGFSREKTVAIKNILENYDIDHTLRNRLKLGEEEIIDTKKNIENREFGFILKNIFQLENQQIEIILNTLERKKLNIVLEDELRSRNEQARKIQESLNDNNLDFVLKNKLKLDEDVIKVIKDNSENKSLDFVLVHILKLNDDQIKLIKSTLDVVLQEELKLDDETIRVIKDNAENKDLDFVLEHELKLDEEKIQFVKNLLFPRNIDSVLKEDCDFDSEKIQECKTILAKKNLDYILKNDFKLSTEQILLIKECLERKDIVPIFKEKFNINDEEITWIKESAQFKDLYSLLRYDFKLTENQIFEVQKSFNVKSLEQVLRDEIKLEEEQIKLINYTQENKYLGSFLKHDLKLTREQIALLQENLKNNNLGFILDKKLNFEEKFAKNIENVLEGRDVDFILKFRLKLSEDEILLTKKSLESKNYGFVLKNIFKLRDQQIEIILDTLEKQKLNSVLEEELKDKNEQLSKIQQNLDDIDLDFVLKNKLKLANDQIEKIKENFNNKDLDFVLKHELKLNFEQIQDVKSTLDFVLKKKLKFKETDVIFVKETLEKQNLDLILKERLKLNDEQIQLVKEVAYQKNFDFILKDELDLTEEQIDLIKHSLNAKTLDFILTKDLALGEEDIKKIKDSVEVKSLDTVLRVDLKLNDEQIELIKKTLNQKDLDYILRNELNLHENEIDLINKKLEEEEEEKKRREEIEEQNKRKAALIDFQKLCLSNKISNEFINSSFENIVDRKGDKRYIISIVKQLKNSKDIIKKVSVITGQKFICYLADIDPQIYSSFGDLIKKFEKNYTTKQLNFDVLWGFLETENINKTLSLIINRIAKKNNFKHEEIVAMAKIINEDLLFLFPDKKKEKKIVLKKKYVLQPKLIGVLQKIFEIDKVNWDFDSSLTENIINIYRENQIKPSELFLPLTSLENIILSLSYLNSISGKERTKHLRQTFEDTLNEVSNKKEYDISKPSPRKDKDNVEKSFDKEKRVDSEHKVVLKLIDSVSISDLANLLKVPYTEMANKCKELRIATSINRKLSPDNVGILANEFGFDVEFVKRDIKDGEYEERGKQKKIIKANENISLSSFATLLEISNEEVLKKCQELGIVASIDKEFSADVLELIAEEFGFILELDESQVELQEHKEEGKDVLVLKEHVTLTEFTNFVNVPEEILIEKCKDLGFGIYKKKKLTKDVIELLAKKLNLEIELDELYLDTEEHEEKKGEEEILTLRDSISLAEFADLINVSKNDVVERCRRIGITAYRNRKLSNEVIEILAKKYGFKAVFVPKNEKKVIEIDETISVDRFAALVDVPLAQILEKCEELGFVASIGKELSFKIINVLTNELGINAEFVKKASQKVNQEAKRILQINGNISLREFASVLKIPFDKVLEKCKKLGIIVTSLDKNLSKNVVSLLAQEYGVNIEINNAIFPEEEQKEIDSKALKVDEGISLAEFATLLKISPNKILDRCKKIGIAISSKKKLSASVIDILAEEFGVSVNVVKKDENEKEVKKDDDLEILEEILYNTLTDRFVNEETKKYLEKKYLKNNQEIVVLNQHYIKNGGLIMTFPFLQYAFFKLNLTDKNNRLKDETSKNNAAHFVEFLLSGKFENGIIRMRLNKLLCGIDVNETIASGYIFSKDEGKKQEEEQMIKSVSDKIFQEIISRWPRLFNVLRAYDEYDEFKDISEEELIRQYIFSRDAVLNVYGTKEYGEEKILYYTMKITTKEYDEEIKNLPWSCDEIFLPYMNYKLYVEYFGGMFYDDK